MRTDVVELVQAHLDSLPRGVTKTTQEVADGIGRALQTLRATAKSERLAAYRRQEGDVKTTPVTWGHPDTIKDLNEQEPEQKPLDDDARLELARSTIRKLENDNRRLRIKLADREETARIIAGAVTPIRVPTLVLPRKTAKPRATFGITLADIHAGEVVDPAQMGGTNAFNWEIAEAGMRDIIRRMMGWAEILRHGFDIPECYLWVLGDVTTGSIHEAQHLEFPVPVASAKAGLLLAEVYGTVGQQFRLNVIQISGNHDRLTANQPFKAVNRDSMAYPAYVIASEACKKVPHINVETPEDPIPVTEINGRYFAAMHGHQIRSNSVSPYYGLARRANALLRERADRALPKIDTVLLGHFHHFAILESAQVVLCPSLLGPNEWSRQQGFQGAPGQLAFLIADHGPFGWTPFERRVSGPVASRSVPRPTSMDAPSSAVSRTGVASLIRDARVAKGLSVGDLGRMLGKTNRTIHAWESGEYRPSRDVASVVADVLGIPPSVLSGT